MQADGLRCLHAVDLHPGANLNVLVGANGSGKSSVLEAIYLLSHGRSFRRGPRDAVLARGEHTLQVFGQVAHDDGPSIDRLGLGLVSGKWDVRINGDSGCRLADLLQRCAVVCFEPGSHALVSGGAEERRQFMDWGVFHVEHNFLDYWQRYRRALKQRNSLLRGVAPVADALLDPWELELDATSRQIDTLRSAYIRALEQPLRTICAQFLPELGNMNLRYRRGWDESRSLQEVLCDNRESDRLRGYTVVGLHRADWRLAFDLAPVREHLSRGQEKLVALACLLAQATLHAEQCGEWPILCLDDLASELDVAHQLAVIDWLPLDKAQIFVTCTQISADWVKEASGVFHVEQGSVSNQNRL